MCGVVGAIAAGPVAGLIGTALQGLQHRGQDSCGIATWEEGRFPVHKGLGLVREVFSDDLLRGIGGHVGLGHVRYPTIGHGVLADAQPFFERRPGVLMAHNGNITNYSDLATWLRERSVHLLSKNDVEPVLCLFADALMERSPHDHTLGDVLVALRAVVGRVQGAYTLVTVLRIDGEPTLVAFRDPRGIRPGVWGRRGDAWMVASESVALDAVGFETVADLEPGEAMFFRAGQEPQRHRVARGERAPCVFEAVYFSRPDSIQDGSSVYRRRLALGRRLAHEWRAKGLEADRVIPVPDTSRPASTAFAEELDIPLREGFIKNRYSRRTFIMADQDSRVAALRLKLNPIREEFFGQRVVIMDDSIVRGTTIKQLLAVARSQEPAELHVAIHAPPVLHPCFYGIDMSTRRELAACRYHAVEQPLDEGAQRALEEGWAADLGVDSLTFLSIGGLDTVFPSTRCAACFDGRYPLPVSRGLRDHIVSDRSAGRRLAP